jgi:hypothetical protein
MLLTLFPASIATAEARVPEDVLAFSGIESFDGSPAAARATPAQFRAVLDELRRAHGAPAAWPDPRARGFVPRQRPGEIVLGLVDLAYGIESASGAPRLGPAGERMRARRAFAFAPLAARTWRGAALALTLDPAFVVTDWGRAPELALDCDDGLGFRPLSPGATLTVSYATTGFRTLRLRATDADGRHRYASAVLEVGGLVTPSPDDTLEVQGAAYAGGSATASAYVYLAPGHATIENPVVVAEGFDLDNSLGWDELYAMLSAENLVEDLRAAGFDLVVLDFTDATDYVQRNAFALVDLIGQLQTLKPPGRSMALIGASMGGLVGRYALAWMESQAMPHDVRTFISFDAPQRGANIPLGIQYWFEFFADQSAPVAALRDVLNAPAARQMLVYHATIPAGVTGVPDPLRGALEAELATLGYPSDCRNVAVANGSGTALSQGFAAAAPIVQWNYDIGLVVIRGNVRAVPDGGSAQIFDGRLFALFTFNRTQSVTVSGTLPYDGAPGGSRNSMQQMDETPAPYGDIVALHASHCFIPTVSAIDLAGAGLFHDLSADAGLPAGTPFDAIYVPDSNQVHTAITAENAVWFRDEIGAGVTTLDPVRGAAGIALAALPNPSAATVGLSFRLPAAAHARLTVFGADGRRVVTLANGAFPAGTHRIPWDGLAAGGRRVPPGVYFARLDTGGAARTVRFVRLD